MLAALLVVVQESCEVTCVRTITIGTVLCSVVHLACLPSACRLLCDALAHLECLASAHQRERERELDERGDVRLA